MRKPLFLTQRYLQQRADLITPAESSGYGRKEWIVARSLCHYKYFALSELPENRWEEALAVKIRQWSPFNHYAEYIVWQDDAVLVWVWDATLQQQSMAQVELKTARSFPESILRPAASQDGGHLLACLEGVEGQIWQAGKLIASRWWLNPPSLREWSQFLRAHSLAAVTEVPSPAVTELLGQPWGKARRSFGGFKAQQERDWVFIGLLIFVMMATWQAVDILKAKTALQQLQTHLDELNEKATPVLTARTAAMNYKQAAERLFTLNSQVTQIELMALVLDKLPQQGAKVVEWAYQSGELKVTIEANNIDPRYYVENFQSQALFVDVKSENGRNSNQIVMSMHIAATTH